jgi:hypothetical protein
MLKVGYVRFGSLVDIETTRAMYALPESGHRAVIRRSTTGWANALKAQTYDEKVRERPPPAIGGHILLGRGDEAGTLGAIGIAYGCR